MGRERKQLEGVVTTLEKLDQGLRDARDLFAMARSENDDSTLEAILGDVDEMETTVAAMEFRRMFSNPMDPNNCFLDIQSGSGGTEAQDWTQMLERMYLKFCDRRGFQVEVWHDELGRSFRYPGAPYKLPASPWAISRRSPRLGEHDVEVLGAVSS